MLNPRTNAPPLELAQPPEFTHPEMRVLFLPRIERRPTHPQLPAHVLDGGPCFLLPERVDHLLFLRTSIASLVRWRSEVSVNETLQDRGRPPEDGAGERDPRSGRNQQAAGHIYHRLALVDFEVAP